MNKVVKIVTDRKFLSKVSVDIDLASPGIRTQLVELVVDMEHAVHSSQPPGIGLAAIQIGVRKRVILVNIGGAFQEFINPVITKRFGGIGKSIEGCLSLPGKQYTKFRHRKIIVEGFTADLQPIRRQLKDIAAYCVQHEIDHCNGITIAD